MFSYNRSKETTGDKSQKGKLIITLATVVEVVAIIVIWTFILFPNVKHNIDTKTVNKKLVGTWELVDGSYKIGDTPRDDYDLEYTFNSDGTGEYCTGVSPQNAYRHQFEWKVDSEGKFIVLNLDDSKVSHFRKIEFDGDEIVMHEVGFFDSAIAMTPEYKLKKK